MATLTELLQMINDDINKIAMNDKWRWTATTIVTVTTTALRNVLRLQALQRWRAKEKREMFFYFYFVLLLFSSSLLQWIL
jgi:hypothetical protein